MTQRITDAAATTQCATCERARAFAKRIGFTATEGPPLHCGHSLAVAMSSETKTPSPEPVAWIIDFASGASMTTDRENADYYAKYHKVTPLFSHPSTARADALREAAEEVMALNSLSLEERQVIASAIRSLIPPQEK